MIISNFSSRLRVKLSTVPQARELERQRIKAATKKLRTHAEKIAWHLADMASQDRKTCPG